jgi:hypothetical protein
VSVVAFAHVLAGGVSHVTPAQGLPTHWLLAHPSGQGWVELE